MSPTPLLATPDLAQVARAMGADGKRITDLAQLRGLADRVRSLRRPLVLDCRVLRENVPI
jgi:thiamine pyrophosphate-dependent acetolactate synthase large subunit-like protein